MVHELIEKNNCEVKDLFVQNFKLVDTEKRRQSDTSLSPSIPQIKTVFGDIVISDSENITIGNIAYFNGSVTIKQFVLPENNATRIPEEPKDVIWSRSVWIVLSIAVFILITVTIFFLFKLEFYNFGNPTRSPINSNESDLSYNTNKNALQIVSRFQWIAQDPTEQLLPQTVPANTVIIGHTGQKGCSTASQCILTVRLLQSHHIDILHFPDLRHNFLIGGDGRAYVGLGWNVSGYHTVGNKNGSVDITFVGNFADFKPDEKQVNTALLLIKDGVLKGKISRDYEILAQCQLSKLTTSPGKFLYLNLTTWSHFNNSIRCTF